MDYEGYGSIEHGGGEDECQEAALPSSSRRKGWARGFASLIGAVVLVSLGTAVSTRWLQLEVQDGLTSLTSTTENKEQDGLTTLTSTTALGLRVQNKYTERLGVPIGSAYPWLGDAAIVDVHKPCDFEVLNADRGDCSYQLDIYLRNESSVVGNDEMSLVYQSTWRGEPFTHTFVKLGMYSATLQEDCGGEMSSVGLTVYAMRVRREVRELDDEDRDALLDTMQTMWTESGHLGRSKYGPDYISAAELQVWHHINSAQRDADHFHQGQGFFVQHARVTLQFESSLRSVNPSLTMPYWDPTIEQTATQLGEADHLFDNELWSATWWGSVEPVTTGMTLATTTRVSKEDDLYAIKDGRFAKTQTMSVDDEFSVGLYVGRLRNAYGLIRAPWNNNPSKYISRYIDSELLEGDSSAFPSCVDHYNATVSPYPRNKWMWYVQLAPHATMHATIGGTLWSPSHEFAAAAFAKITNRKVAAVDLNRVVKQHTLYRLRILEFPPDCNDTYLEDCQPRCNVESWTYQEIGRQIVLTQDISDIFASNTPRNLPFADDYDSFVKTAETDLDRYLQQLENADPADLRSLGEYYCEQPGMSIEGDQKDSSGALDPVFWTIHPTMERLYQLRLLNGVGFYDDSWPSNAACSGSRADLAITENPDFLFGYQHANDMLPANPLEICEGHFADSTMFCGDPTLSSQDEEDARMAQAIFPERPVRDSISGGSGAVKSIVAALDFQPATLDMASLQLLYCDSTDPSIVSETSSLGRTNRDILNLLDPRPDPVTTNYEYPVYHHFRWDHCAAVGVEFPDLV